MKILYTIISFLFSSFLLLLSFSTLAQQAGLGGVSDTDHKVIWLRAADLQLQPNEPVSLWTDASGNENDASQSNSNNQPEFIPSVGDFFNDQPVVRFNGSSAFMDIANSTELNGMAGLTIIFVMKPNVLGTQAFLTKRIDWGNQNRFGFLTVNGTLRFDVENTTQSSSQGLNINTSYLLTGMYNGTLAGNKQFVYQNTVLRGSTNNNFTSIGSNTEPVRLGRFNDGDDRFLNGDVAEVLVYRTGLNNAERLIVENVLAIKYNINIGANAQYSPGSFHNDIIGVGTTGGNQKHSASTGAGGGLLLAEYDNGFNQTNQFVFAGHDGTEHSITESGVEGLQGVEDRWSRVWRIERRTAGNVDEGDTPISITFDFQETGNPGLTPDYNNVYVLLFKNDSGDTDFSMVDGLYASAAGDRVTFNVPDEPFKTGYYTLGRYTDDAAEFMIKTWTSQKSGNWSDPDVWRDQFGVSGTPNNSLTKTYDNIVIRDGHIVNANGLHNLENNDLFLEPGGILRLGDTQGHKWGSIRGQGTLEIIGDYFPEGNAQEFIKAGGGTTVYYGGGNFAFEQSREFNNLTIRLSDLASNLTLLANITINGNFHIDRGTFNINDGSGVSRRITVAENLQIAASVSQGANVQVRTGTGNARHYLTVRGDFTANGPAAFCNITDYSYGSDPSNGITEVIFNHPTRHQTASINAATNFYRIEIDKGINDTYKLLLRADGSNKFRLLGRNNFAQTGTPPNRTNRNALGLLAGTVVIGDHISIPVLKSGNDNYDIDEDARIVVDGGYLNNGNNMAIVVYGNLTLENGELIAQGQHGVTIRETGTFEVHGGEASLHIMRTSVIAGVHRGAYVQTAGDVTVDGTGGENTHYRFSLPYNTNSFTMTGGVLNVKQPKNGGSADRGGILIGADKQFIQVTGGTVNAIIDRDKDFIINSNAPFYNLNLIREVVNNREFILLGYGGGGVVPANPARPLEVLNKLEVFSTPHPARLNLSGQKAIIHGDFIIQTGAQFNGLNSHLSFVGERDSNFEIVSNSDVFVLDTLSVNKSESEYQLILFSNRGVLPVFLDIASLLQVNRGLLDYRHLTLGLRGDLELRDRAGKSAEPGRIAMQGAALQHIRIPAGNTTAYIGRLEVDNSSGVLLQNNSIPEMRELVLTNGVLDIQNFGIKLTDGIKGEGFDENKMVMTAGNHSDAGVSLRVSAAGPIHFPIGTNANGQVRYTPLEAEFSLVNDPVFLQLNPVDMELATLANSNPDQALQYYWRIRHSETATSAQVASYTFHYAATDLPDPATNFVPGKIVDYERSFEQAINFTTSPAEILFNGNGEGFPLERGEYTAGLESKFDGRVRVFYSRRDTGGWNPFDWHNSDNWSLTSHTVDDNPGDDIPGQGDIVHIGHSGNIFHLMEVSSNVHIGGLHFNRGPVGFPWLYVRNQNIDVQLGNVSGEGRVAYMFGANNPNLTGDFGEFSEEELSEFVYQSNTNNGIFTLPSHITTYPNLRFESPSDNPATFHFPPDVDLLVKRDLWVNRSITAMPATSTNGDIQILGNLRIGQTESNRWGVLQFNAAGESRHISVQGNFVMQGNGSTAITTENSTSAVTHRLSVAGNIMQEAGSITLGTENTAKVELHLKGENDAEYIRTGGTAPSFYRIVMDKGSNQNYHFSFRNDFSIYGDASGNIKPIILENGILELASSAIAFDINTGGAEFNIPASSGLVLRDAILTLSNPSEGILLDGLLKLEGIAELSLNGAGTYLMYGSSGKSQLEVHDDATLIVGSQLRSSTTFTTGILRYLQTGGTVRVGMHGAPDANRGVFEVFREGSSFRFTGGELMIVRGHSGSEASLNLDPSDFLLGTDAVLRIGHPSYTPNSNTVHIRSTIPLPNVVIEGGSNFAAELSVEPVRVSGDFVLANGNTFRTRNLDMELQGDFINRGNFIAGANTVSFTGNVQLLSGDTDFNRLQIHPAVEVVLGQGDEGPSDILVLDDLEILSGTLDDQGNTIELKSDLLNVATHHSSGSAGGLLFSSNVLQNIYGNGAVGRMTIHNNEGVRLQNALQLSNELVFEVGILDIRNHRLTLLSNSSLTAAGFSSERMISTGGTIAAAGIRLFMDGPKDYLLPLGVTGKYTPVEIKAGSIDESQGTYLDVLPINQKHVNVTDPGNLKYYWRLESHNLSNFTGDLEFHYVQTDVEPEESEYESARLFEETWNKLPSLVDEANNIIQFPFDAATNQISGDYTAGSKIPEEVLRFRSTGSSQDWSQPSAWENRTNLGEVPEGGPLGQIIEIMPGHTITTGGTRRIAYKSFVDGTLDMGSSAGHYLGEVDGSGHILVEGPTVPVGRYDEFAAPGKGTFEYAGNTNYVIDPTYLPASGKVNHLIFSGSGNRILPAKSLEIHSDIEIRQTAILDNTQNNSTITLSGNLLKDNSAGFRAGSGSNAFILFNGNTTQRIEGDFSADNALFELQLDNSQGLEILGSTDIERKIEFRNGLIYTTEENTLRLLGAAEAVGYNFNRYVDGPLQKLGTSAFVFPVGSEGRLGRVSFRPSGSFPSGTVIEAQYFPQTHYFYEQAEAPLQRVSSVEYWSVARIDSDDTPNGRVRLYFEDSSFSGITDPSGLLVGRFYPDDWWRNQGRYNSSGQEGANAGWVESNPVTGMGLFSFATDNWSFSNNPLPVEWLSFTVRLSDRVVVLEWETASEVNNDYFTIERSKDGLSFETIGYLQGAGTTSEKNAYRFIDHQPFTGISYYRIKQTDFDGTIDYSDVKAIQLRKLMESIVQIYPNPAVNGRFQILMTGFDQNEQVSLLLVDMHGRSVYSGKVYTDMNGMLQKEIHTHNRLPAGMYFLVIQSKEGRITERIMMR